MELIEVKPSEWDVDLEIAYATAHNFTGEPVYARAACFLHEDAVGCLEKAVDLAALQGYRLKIFDAYRPTEAQAALWAHTPDPEFLSPPERGSPHSRGVAIDLTLLDAAGRVLDMGTPFDAFTSLSHHGNVEISIEAQRNRFMLLGIMMSAGWDFYMNEWWHYQLFNSRSYPLLTDAEAGTRMMGHG